MEFKNLEKICLVIIGWGSYLILFLPLLVYRQTLYPYIFGKIIGFRILVEIIFAFWIILAVSDKRYRPNFKNPLIIALTIFIVVLFLTAITGLDFNRSLFSTQERMTGVLTILHFWAWFLILTSTFKNFKDWRKLILATLIASFLVGLYGLGQKLGLKFLLQETDPGRMTSTLGNPIFLGVYSMLHIFLAGFLLTREKKWLWRGLAIFFLIFNLAIMLLTASRGVMVALGLSLFLFFVFLIFSLPSRRTKKIVELIFILLTIAALAGFIFLQTQREKPWIYKAPTFIIRIIYFTVSSEQRIIPWQIALDGFKEKPILGWGIENYNIVFNKYFRPQIFRWGQEGTWFDRSHNQIMDLLVLTGIIGIISYLAIFGVIFWLLFQRVRPFKGSDPKENSCYSWSNSCLFTILALMFVAYFIQNLFVFDTPAPLIVFYFSLGIVYFITNENNPKLRIYPNAPNKTKNYSIIRPNKGNGFPLPVLIFLICLFFIPILYWFNLKPFNQSRQGVYAVIISQNDFSQGLAFYKKSLSQPSFTNPEIRLQLAKSVLAFSPRLKEDEKLYKKAIELTVLELEKSVDEHPLDIRYRLYLGQFYNLSSNFIDKQGQENVYLVKAENVLAKAHQLAPNRQDIDWLLANTKMLLGKSQEGIELFEKALYLDPEINQSWWHLGLAYLVSGQTEKGLRTIETAGKKGYSYLSTFYHSAAILLIADSYGQMKNYSQAIYHCDVILAREPENVEALAKKIIYLAQSGDKTGVEKLLKDLEEKNPQVAEQIREILKLF